MSNSCQLPERSTLSDGIGQLVLSILLTFAQFERKPMAGRVRDTAASMKRRANSSVTIRRWVMMWSTVD